MPGSCNKGKCLNRVSKYNKMYIKCAIYSKEYFRAHLRESPIHIGVKDQERHCVCGGICHIPVKVFKHLSPDFKGHDSAGYILSSLGTEKVEPSRTRQAQFLGHTEICRFWNDAKLLPF